MLGKRETRLAKIAPFRFFPFPFGAFPDKFFPKRINLRDASGSLFILFLQLFQSGKTIVGGKCRE